MHTHPDELALMKDLQKDVQSRHVELRQARLSPRRRAFVWGAALVGLVGAGAIIGIQRSRDEAGLRELIARTAERHGLDPALVEAVVHAESKGSATAESHAKAYGLMQLQVPTASDMAGRDVTRDELFDPELNLELGCRYLVWLGKRFDGDLRLVLMAYNAGRGRVQEWQKKSSDVDEILQKHAYAETRGYVHKVLGFRRTIREEMAEAADPS